MKKLICAVLVMVCLIAAAVPVSAVDYTVTHSADGIVIDGAITAEEWGEPMWSGAPRDVVKKEEDGWAYKKYTPEPANQTLSVYFTNDGDYMYFGCQLKGAVRDMSCESIAELTTHPHFGILVAGYNEKTVIPRILYNNAPYEQYAYYCIGFINGEKGQVCRSQGLAVPLLDDSDFEVSYDNASRTYTYECRIPYKYANVALNQKKAVVSFDVGDAPGTTSAGVPAASGNRYLLSRGAETAHGGGGAYYFATGKSDPFIVNLLSTADLATRDFVPTDAEAAAAAAINQGPLTVTVYEQPGSWTVVWILASAAGVCLLLTAAVFIFGRKRRRR